MNEAEKDRFAEHWKDLEHAGTMEERYHCWLTLQCELISGAVSGVLVMRKNGTEEPVPVSRWPEVGGKPEIFTEILDQVLERKCGLLTDSDRKLPSPHYLLAYPVLVGTGMQGVAAIEVSAFREEDLRLSMAQLQWGVSWLELFHRRQEALENTAVIKRLTAAVTLLAQVVAEEKFEGASMSLVTSLAGELACDRVSIGFAGRRKMRVRAFSHSARFSERMNLVRCIGRAMDEAVIQRREIAYPHDGEELVIVREHRQLSRQYGAGSILTIPLYEKGWYYGAATLERPSDKPFSENEREFCRTVISLAGPVLEGKRIQDRHLLLKIGDSLKVQLKRLIGPRHVGRKLLLVSSILIIVFFAVKQADYRISADTVLEGEMVRAVSAPFTGYIKESTVRAGDVVDEDQVVCRLDDADLRLERLNWLSQRIQLNRQHQEALATHNRAEVKIIDAKIKQAEAQLNLVENRLERTRIRAPFRGVLVRGDLTQLLGAMVQQGDVLFEVAPLDEYRVVLMVSENRIADVREGQSGTLVLSALPGQTFHFQVEKITPISVAEEGENRFRVEARLERVSGQLRPGMEGVGKIMVDRRNLFSIWSRTLREKLSLWLWAWLP